MVLVSKEEAIEKTLETSYDHTGQYSRRNSLQKSGFAENASVNTDDIKMKLADDLDINIELSGVESRP